MPAEPWPELLAALDALDEERDAVWREIFAAVDRANDVADRRRALGQRIDRAVFGGPEP